MQNNTPTLLKALFFLTVFNLSLLIKANALEFNVSADKALFQKAYSTRLYVFIINDMKAEPRKKINWFNPPPMVAKDVSNWQGEKIIRIDEQALSFPQSLSKLKKGTYRIQALLRTHLDAPFAVSGAGNFISEPINVELDGKSTQKIALKLTHKIPVKDFKETNRIKAFHFKSPALSHFYGRDYVMHAGVALPKNYDPSKKYPTLYAITGFGGTYFSIKRYLKMMGVGADNLILIVPDASNHSGHSVFVDSENIGPWGSALVNELIPAIEKKYGGMGSKNRYLTGVSSGGWSSLWLQIQHPDDFKGVWAMVPDPVDFHDFQNINLYAKGENMYVDAKGNKRPLARAKGKVRLWYKNFVAMEEILGDGGQIHSFEATFSKKGKDGKPELIFDRKTGNINHQVAMSWQKFDISHKLQKEWKSLAPKLKGKLHIFAGEIDTFYLDGAVRLLKQTLKKLGSDAEVQIVPGMVHQPVPGIGEKIGKAIAKG